LGGGATGARSKDQCGDDNQTQWQYLFHALS
jgi:hypothetical protein